MAHHGYRILATLQPLGRALMLPIAVLPVAGLLLRLGQPDILGLAFVAGAGSAIFTNLGLLFAIGVAVGLARENHGAAGLAGAVAFLVTVEGAKALLIAPTDLAGIAVAHDAVVGAWRAHEVGKLTVPAGILSGLAGGLLYNRFHAIRLPEYLAFFGGRRFVPIAAGGFGVVLAGLLGWGYPALSAGIDAISRWVVGAGWFGLFLYGMLNRLLLITGLHHILNNVVWFIVGDYHGASGDLNRFFAGDPSAGAFMSGFFPVMMFGLPAACLAMYRTALPERRAEVAGLFASLAATSFLTGVTEPIEFTFIFVAPLLFAVHAVLTGVAMAVMNLIGVRLGFGFSAGLLDYLINFRLATRPLLLLPVGAVYFALYYGVFRFCIVRFDLATPGRRSETAADGAPTGADDRVAAFVAALGGAGNLVKIDACTTRLRLVMADPAAINEAALRRLGARGVVRPGGGALQVVIGPTADALASDIRRFRGLPAVAAPPPPAPDVASVPLADFVTQERAGALVRACGGAANLDRTIACGSRLVLAVHDQSQIDHAALARLSPHGVAQTGAGVHLLLDDADNLARLMTG
ncbi:PTS N-acetyl-D-glucosamine transporter [Novosphingobium sp. FSW06-99]|nr:N-acetylglucosamine-specific PTS transporter subunit IIBC [Novosphingobium sp. FSW06-99]KUR72102.1 PTS N-acetyl-D-glucosamine transporter [Novosphingobium sp. FSW06-99]